MSIRNEAVISLLFRESRAGVVPSGTDGVHIQKVRISRNLLRLEFSMQVYL